jgi:type II secretory pathway pseudopilin PulG
MTTAQQPGPRMVGFALIELAVVIAVLGLLIAATSAAYTNIDRVGDRQQAKSHAESVRDALRAYALSHGHLPCPEPYPDPATSSRNQASHGRSGDCDSGSGPARGWVPYRTIGMSVPGPGYRAFYAVHRDGTDADLAAIDSARLTDDALIRGLRAIGARSQTAYIDANPGSSGCRRNGRAVAFFVIVPLADRDGDGQRFDDPHPDNCASPPSLGARHDNDDLVIVESPAALVGWLQRP